MPDCYARLAEADVEMLPVSIRIIVKVRGKVKITMAKPTCLSTSRTWTKAPD